MVKAANGDQYEVSVEIGGRQWGSIWSECVEIDILTCSGGLKWLILLALVLMTKINIDQNYMKIVW